MVQRIPSISNGDEWGRDPSVRTMRQVFHCVEVTQGELLVGLHISPFDPKLRGWREAALGLFERAWGEASRRELSVGEKEAAVLYTRCLLRVLVKDGVTGADKGISGDEKIRRFLEEVMP